MPEMQHYHNTSTKAAIRNYPDSKIEHSQSGTKCGVGVIALAVIFWLIARILTIFNKKYRILTRRDKRESYLIVLQQNNV